jgi:hypothetical protein
MPDRILGLLGSFPFLLITNSGKVKFNTARITEAIIIAIITGLVSGYVMMQRMDVKVTYMEKQMESIQTDVKHHLEWDTMQGPGMGGRR